MKATKAMMKSVCQVRKITFGGKREKVLLKLQHENACVINFFFLQKEMGWSNGEGLVSRFKTEASSDLADFCCGQLLISLHPQKEDNEASQGYCENGKSEYKAPSPVHGIEQPSPDITVLITC